MVDDVINKLIYDADLPGYLFVNQYPVFGFIWNFILLMIPFGMAFWLKHYYRAHGLKNIGNKTIFFLIFFLWLIFVPNSAYIITDIRHLLGFCPNSLYRVCVSNAWMIMVFFSYSVMGWVAYVYLLRDMKIFLQEINPKISVFFIPVIIPFISLGVLIGLVNRWNSWEIFSQTQEIMIDLLNYFYRQEYFINLVIYTFFFYLLYFAGDKIFKK